MAIKRKRNEQNGVKDGSWGYSQESLAELERGVYGKTTNRKARYNSSSEQTRQAHELPALEGMASKAIWESNYGKNRKSPNVVDTRSARRKYEQRIGHYADDARNLRNQGYNSSYKAFDFSDYDDQIDQGHQIDFGILTNRGVDELAGLDSYLPGGEGKLNIETYIKHPELITPKVRQQFINQFGAPMDEVIPAYQSYVEERNRKYAEEHPIRVGLEDIGSAFERGNAATTARLANKIAPNTKVSDYFNSDKYLGKVNEVEKKRDYVRTSQNLSETEKNLYNMLYGGGDWLSSSLTGGLLTGGVGVANPETGFALTVQPSKLVKALTEAYTKFGLGRTQEYGNLKRRGVSEEEAQKMADFSGAMAGATAGATAGLGGFGGTTGSALENLAWAFGRSAAVGGVSQAANEFAEKKILDEQSIYELSKQAYITQGLSEEEATKKADADRATRIGGAALINGLVGAGSNLISQGVSNIKNALVPVENDPLNSVWATQDALPQNDIPLLTGSVDNTQALTGSTYNVPALVDNIYPIQMPGTQGVIPMPGTNGVIAPVVGQTNMPEVSGASAPVANKVANEWLSWQNPRLVKKLEGAELESAKAQVESNGRQIEAIQRQIKGITENKSNYYRGNLKKAVQADVRKLEGQIKELEKSTKDLKLQMKGGLKPVLDMLTKEQKDLIYDTSGKHDSVFSQINFAVKFAGDTPEAKALAKRAQNAIREYVKTGSRESSREIVAALTELDNMAKSVNAVYKSSKGNEWTYEQAFGDQAQYLYHFQPVYDIYNAEKLAAKAAREAAQSAPVEAPVQTPTPQTANNKGLYPEEIAAKALEDKYPNLKQYSDQPVMVRKSEIPEDVLSNILGENFDNELESVKLGGELAKRGYNVWENGYNNNMMGHAWSIMEDAVAHHLAKDLIPSATMAEAYDIVAQRGGTLDEAIRLAAQMAGTTIDDPVPGSNIVIGDGSGANAPVETPAPTPLENEPNFSLIGEPYTPQEVPNVQPTPPTTPPPTEEVPNMGGTEKTSQYYKNTMRGTETNRDMSDEEYANRFNEELFKRMTIPEQQSVSQGQKFIEESGGNEAAIQRLLSGDFDSEERFSGYHIDAAQMLANDIERQALELEANGQDASQLWRTANKLHKKIQLNASDFGVGLQALQKWKRATPQGAYDDLISQINKGIDKKKTTGYTRKVENLSDKIIDAVENTEDKSSLIQKIKDIFAKDRENNPYNTKKAEQLVLDLVGGDKNTKMSITDLADEASRLIKKEMGTSTLTPKEERAILNLLDAASKLEPGTREYNVLVSRAMTIVDDSLPSTFGEKFKSLLYDNMLASIKTMFTRNFGGNVVGNTIDFMAAPFQVGADALVGKFTGERTRALTGKSIVEAAKGLGHGFKDWGQDIGYSIKNKTLLNTSRSGQESLADVLHAVHKTWKTQSNNKAVKGIHNALATYDYIIRKGMEGGDRPIYEAQYAATQAELYHLVKKYGDAGLRKGLPADKRDVDTDDLIDMIAIDEALEAVLQNDSKMKEAAKNIKAFFRKASEDMVGIDVASMSHAPFVEVPANMASNFFKLTPVGWVGNINRTIGEKRKYGSINQRRFTGELGLNVLGGLMGAGLFAVANKIISDKYSEDKDEKKLQQNNGYQEYALQAPDESWQADISDIPYLGAMMKFAKMERDAYNEDGAKGVLSALPSAIGAATVDTLYQSLNRLTGADFQYNGSGNLVGNAINNIKSSVGSMGVPSWLRQTAQFTDPYKRDLGDYGSDEYNKNLIINGIPGLRQTMLDPKIDTAGQPVPELGGATGFNRFMSAYINPWKVSHPHDNTSAVQEYANMLKQATEGKVNPQMKVVNKSDITKIKGYDAENYSHKDLRDFQEEYYKSNTEYGNALINDPWFTNLSYEKQGELLDELWKANKALCQENFVRKGKTPEEIEAAGDELYTTDNKLAGILRDDDENHTGLLKWLKDETSRDAMNEKYGTNMSHDDYVEYNSREAGYAEQRASEADKAKALGMNVTDYEKYEAEYPGGAQGRYDDANAAREYGFVNTDKTVNLDAYNIAKDLGDGDPTVIQAYSDYKQRGIKSNAYSAKANYLFNDDRLTDEQKGMIIAGSQDGTNLGNVASGARGMYEAGGNDYAGIYYYYLLKNMADTDGSGRISKDEREAFFANDNPYLDELWDLSHDMYNYLKKNLK